MFVGRTGPVTHRAVTWSRQLPSDYQPRLSIGLWRRGSLASGTLSPETAAKGKGPYTVPTPTLSRDQALDSDLTVSPPPGSPARKFQHCPLCHAMPALRRLHKAGTVQKPVFLVIPRLCTGYVNQAKKAPFS